MTNKKVDTQTDGQKGKYRESLQSWTKIILKYKKETHNESTIKEINVPKTKKDFRNHCLKLH